MPFEPEYRGLKKKEQAAKSEPLPPKSSVPSKTSQGKGSSRKATGLSPVPERSATRPKSDPLGIPPVVNRRMVGRAAWFCGIPTVTGVIGLVGSFAVVSNHLFPLPNTAVVLLSMACFGAGVLGLSYGVLSASWEPDRVGSWWGWAEFSRNFGYLKTAWQERNQQQKSKKGTPS
ncbi:MAG: DUF3464 family protein [Oscillatoriales cyanobacterium SM2_2_1]|nr:DUF3464 family protein [Oscillatoriales cyanobacterium SM2_2_1]